MRVLSYKHRSRHAAKISEGLVVTFQESLGVLGGKGDHEAIVGMRQIETLEVRLLLDARDHHQRLAEIGLCISRRMRQRHEHFLVLQPRLAHVILHHRVAAAERRARPSAGPRSVWPCAAASSAATGRPPESDR